jgi:hypothetical protein
MLIKAHMLISSGTLYDAIVDCKIEKKNLYLQMFYKKKQNKL